MTTGKTKLGQKGMGAALAVAMLVSPASVMVASANTGTTPDTGTTAPNIDTINIVVSNQWLGNEAQSMMVNLLANGQKVADVALDAAGGWTHTFADLPKTDANGEIAYTIEPDAGLTGYDVHVNGDAANGFTLASLEKPDNPGYQGTPLDIDVEKSWVGDEGDKATVMLLANGIEVGEVTLTAAGGWKHEFADLPSTMATGGTVTYTLAEGYSAGYDTVITGNQDQGFIVSNIKEQDAVAEGAVVTKYVDADGKEIALRDTVSGAIGEPYQTASKNIAGYKVKEVAGDEAGKFGADITEVIYVYELVDKEQDHVEGNVIVKYVDADGKEIALRDTQTGKLDTEFKLTAKEIAGYKLEDGKTTISGKFEQGVKTVTFTYVEDKKGEASVMGSVVVKYVDKNGNEIANRERLTGKIGEAYKTTERKIDGYTFLRATGSGAKDGKFAEGITIIEYQYEAVALESRVSVKYVDESGKEISERVNRSGKIGERYTTEQKKINGYEFVNVRGAESGQYVSEATEVTYVYKQIIEGQAIEGKVVVKHVNNQGKEITSRDNLTGKVGETYSIQPKQVQGYTHDKTNGDTANVFREGVLTVLVTYKQNEDAFDKAEPVDNNGGLTINPVKPPTVNMDAFPTVNTDNLTMANPVDSTTTSYAPVGSVVPNSNTGESGSATTITYANNGGQESTDGTTSANATDASSTTTVQNANNGQQDGTEQAEQGKELANTSTNTFNLLAIGSTLLAAVAIGFLAVNRRRNGVTEPK